LGVEADVAESVEMHLSMSDANGVMSMGQQMSIEVPANSTVAFKPGALHVMLLSLRNDLAVGDTFTITLKLRNAGDVPVTVTVQDQ
jgi:copper(I)-binding protein